MTEVNDMNYLFVIKIFIFLVSLSALACSLSQELEISRIENVNQSPQEETNKLPENLEAHLVFKEDGWIIPDLKKCKIIEKNKKLNLDTPKPVFRNIYLPSIKELLVTTRPAEKRVVNVHEFIIEGRKFCYIFAVTEPLPKDPNMSSVALTTNFTYYDLDGDGIFETSDKRFSYLPLLVPRWVE